MPIPCISLDTNFALAAFPSAFQNQFPVHFELQFNQKNNRITFSRASRFVKICTAALKRRVKERDLDDVINRQKKLNLVSSIVKVLLQHPNNEMTISELSKHRKRMGLATNRRMLPILRRYSSIFEVHENPTSSFHSLCKLTSLAEDLCMEEINIQAQIEETLVQNLRKLLMMSATKRILLDKIAVLGPEMGLPLDFKRGICCRHPDFFKVVDTDYGPALELTSWDPALAVAFAETSVDNNDDDDRIVKRPRKYRKLNLPNGFRVSKKEKDFLLEFQVLPFISPYTDASELDPYSIEAEKRDCAVLHELLSLTLEKKLPVYNVTLFKHEFKYFHKIRTLLLRHPDMFYISLRGGRDSVFLRAGYRGSELKEKSDLVVWKEKLQSLISMRNKKIEKSENDVDGSEGERDSEEYTSDGSLDDASDKGDHADDTGHVSVENEQPGSHTESEFFKACAIDKIGTSVPNLTARELW